MRSLALKLTVPVALVAIWWVATANTASLYFPPLSEIADEFMGTWFFERFSADLLPSVLRLVAGFALAVVVGLALGSVLGLSTRARRAVSPLTEMLRSTPVPALVPLALVFFGPGAKMEIALIAFGSCWPIVLNTADGVRGVDPVMHEMARSYGLSRWQRLRIVTMPSALPQIFAGLRVALAIATAAMVVSNMFASDSGLGFFVVQAQQSFDATATWAGLLIIGLIGLVANLLFVLGERRALAWHRGWRAAERK